MPQKHLRSVLGFGRHNWKEGDEARKVLMKNSKQKQDLHGANNLFSTPRLTVIRQGMHSLQEPQNILDNHLIVNLKNSLEFMTICTSAKTRR